MNAMKQLSKPSFSPTTAVTVRVTVRRWFSSIIRLQVFMSYRIALIFFVLIALLLAGCSKSNVQVISSVYGSGTNFADVSHRVAELVHQGPGFNAQPGWLKVDPTPGWNKVLVIIYEVKGRRHIFAASEGDR